MAQPKLQTWGLEADFPQIVKQNQLTVELKAFGIGGTEKYGGPNKEQHGKHIVEMAYPWIWRYWNDWLELILWAWCNYEEIGATGCGGSGKTFGFSLCAWMEWISSPRKSALMLTSPTGPSLRAKLWPRIKDLNNKMVEGNRYAQTGFNLVDSMTKIQPVKGDDEHAVQAVAVDSGKLEDAIGKVQGRHPERMIIVVDEGEQTPDAIFTSRANLRIGTQVFKFCSMANAINPFSAYGIFIAPKLGWNTVSERDEMWETKTGIVLHFHGSKSPNVKAGKVVVPGLITQKDIDAIIANHGMNSLEYWAYVAGFPAPSGVRNTVLDSATIFAGNAQKEARWQSTYELWAALDAAFTTGGDRCILRFARVGFFLDGFMGMELLPPIHIKFLESKEFPINYQIADKCMEECANSNVGSVNFSMDATSASGLADIIGQRWARNIKLVQFGGKAPDIPVSDIDRRSRKEVYFDRVTDLWFATKQIVENGRFRGLDAETATEFCSRKYTLEKEKYILESKKEMKKRTGGQSPDLADPVAILCDRFRDEFGPQKQSTATQAGTNKEWEQAAKRLNLHRTKRSYAAA